MEYENNSFGIRYLSVFMLGFLSCALLFLSVLYYGDDVSFVTGNALFDAATPKDRINESHLKIFSDSISIAIANATISRYAATGSMKPLIGEHAQGIRIVPQSSDEIYVGDIVTFRFEGSLIVHRVQEISVDELGTYYITQGDSSFWEDEKIRFEDIEYVTVGVLW